MQSRIKASWKLGFLALSGEDDRPGLRLFEMGDVVGAVAAARRALKDVVRSHGSDRAEALPNLDLLGMFLVLNGREEEGAAILREALDISTRHLGDDRRAMYDRLQNLGLGELHLGRPREALRHFGKAREGWEGVARLGPEFQVSALGAQCMEAVALAEDGREGQALALLEEAVSALERMDPSPRRDKNLMIARENLRLAHELVRRGGAPQLGWEALHGAGTDDRGRFRWTVEDPGTWRDDPAREMRGAGDLAGAEAKALEALALLPGPGAPGRDRALPLLDSLGQTLVMASRHAEALPYLAEAFSISTRLLGSGHDWTLVRNVSMGMAMLLSGRAEEGLARLAEAAAARAALYGREDPKTLVARTGVGIALASFGRLERAVAVFRDVLAVTERLGPDEIKVMVPSARHNLRLAEEWLEGRG
ncbi:MAG: tetratricopeptide repeat protein [Deltaproteobacteria bacterium]|jgi:tetratricopeptide (TPR) repeat protein|nr:tetratricopeptide repeat protein [Deltaproteobacteria bacterium]